MTGSSVRFVDSSIRATHNSRVFGPNSPTSERSMKFRRAAILSILTVLTIPISAQKSDVHVGKSNIRADNNPEAVESVKKLELELCDLIVRGEWNAYASHLTDDYMRILPGKIQSKEEVLNEFRTSSTKTTSMVPEQMDLRIYGDTAIAILLVRSREHTPDGQSMEHRGRGTKVFVRRKWKMVPGAIDRIASGIINPRPALASGRFQPRTTRRARTGHTAPGRSA